MKFNVQVAALYFFSVFILFLAGAYFGSLFIILFYALLALPVLSFFLLAIHCQFIKYFQNFSTLRPAKGEEIRYELILVNESVFPIPYLTIHFKSLGPSRQSFLKPLSVYIRGGKKFKKEYTIRCPYRGIYTVGIEKIEVRDILRIVSVSLPVQEETFYVYPRILELSRFFTVADSMESVSGGSDSGGFPDYTLFKQLNEYRDGESIRHISWKKLASTGIPYLKSYESSASPDVRIYLDLRACRPAGSIRYEQEDVSIEILTAMVKYFLEKRLDIQVRAPGEKSYHFTGDNPDYFKAFYESTVDIRFQNTISPAALYRLDRTYGEVKAKSIILITHIMDADTFALAEEYLEADRSIIIVFNHTGYGETDREKFRKYFFRLRQKNGLVVEVEGPDTIQQDLQKRVVILSSLS